MPQTPYPPVSIPWWKSKIIVGAAVSITTKLLVLAGVAGGFTEAETAQIIDLVLILFGAVGDLVAIGSRVRQRYIPKITPTTAAPTGKFLSIGLAMVLIMPLMGCAAIQPNIPPAPAAIADQSKIDEQAALTLTLAYTGAARAAALAIEAGLVKSPATIRRIGELDRAAYSAVKATESAYRAGNAETYTAALINARTAVGQLLASANGDVK